MGCPTIPSWIVSASKQLLHLFVVEHNVITAFLAIKDYFNTHLAISSPREWQDHDIAQSDHATTMPPSHEPGVFVVFFSSPCVEHYRCIYAGL